MAKLSESALTITLPHWVNEEIDWGRVYHDDEQKSGLAIELAALNVKEKSGGPFGAAVFDSSGNLISVGVNRVTILNNSTLHAEMLAIMLAEKAANSYHLASKRYELFTSCEPCAMCLGAVLWSGVSRLVCCAEAQDAAAIGFDEGPVFSESYNYLSKRGIEIVRGVSRQAAREVLLNYKDSGGVIYNGK